MFISIFFLIFSLILSVAKFYLIRAGVGLYNYWAFAFQVQQYLAMQCQMVQEYCEMFVSNNINTFQCLFG